MPLDLRLRESPDLTNLHFASGIFHPMVKLLHFLEERLLSGFEFEQMFTPNSFSPVESEAEKIKLTPLGVTKLNDASFVLMKFKPILVDSLVQLLKK